jgi:hypothetical protein
MVARMGDASYPVANYFAGPIDGRNIGVELECAESEAEFRADKLKMARLFLAPDAAEVFASD